MAAEGAGTNEERSNKNKNLGSGKVSSSSSFGMGCFSSLPFSPPSWKRKGRCLKGILNLEQRRVNSRCPFSPPHPSEEEQEREKREEASGREMRFALLLRRRLRRSRFRLYCH